VVGTFAALALMLANAIWGAAEFAIVRVRGTRLEEPGKRSRFASGRRK
jgi:hypothetical protein